MAIDMIALARQEAVRCRVDAVGPEHFLLALLQDGRSAAVEILRELGVNLERIRQEIEWNLAPSTGAPPGQLPLSPQAQGVWERAKESAGGREINPEHLLLALVRGGGLATEVLAKVGVRYEDVLGALDAGDR